MGMPEAQDDPEDLIAIGMKIVEMATRLKVMNAVCPGAKARWSFEMDDLRFDVACTISATPPPPNPDHCVDTEKDT